MTGLIQRKLFSMASTKRSQNKCKDCGYTWYPRGKSISLKCPNCGSQDVKIASGWIGAGIVIVLAFIIFSGDKKTNQRPASDLGGPQSAMAEAPVKIAEPTTRNMPDVARSEVPSTEIEAPVRAVAAETLTLDDNERDESQQPNAGALTDDVACLNLKSENPDKRCKAPKPSDQF